MSTLTVEVRRCLHRRVVWTLIAMAVVGCATAGLIGFLTSAGKTTAELAADNDHPALLVNWWRTDGDSLVGVSAFFLVLGGLFGGASVTGAEWRAGTVATVLGWEPRRVRLHVARVGACVLLAFVISAALQALFLAAFTPAVLANGSTAGVDAAWWSGLLLAVGRVSLLTGLAAGIGASLSTLGRNTAFGVMVAFGWIAVVEGMVRGLKPGWAQHLVGENATTMLTWATLDDPAVTRGPLVATMAVLAYSALIGAAALLSFTRRDVTAA